MAKKLFIPGPVDIAPGAFEAMSAPMIGHRGTEFSNLLTDCVSGLKKLMYTGNEVFLFPASSTGVMEAAVRNCVKERCLSVCNGAFSERWHGIAEENGKNAEALSFDWGCAPDPKQIDEKLSTGEYDALTLVHNETSTGVTAPVKEIANVVKKYDVSFLVDTVSSMGGVKIEVDELGIDVCLFGTQKCMALPPGLAACSVSERALEKAASITYRGHYFDFLAYKKSMEKKQTPTTPAISIMQGLRYQLDRILDHEGLDNRFARHTEMAGITREWARKNFALYPEERFSSNTVSCIRNTREMDCDDLKKRLSDKGYVFAPGYGSIREETFRIAHMGERTVEELREYLEAIDGILGL
ncbi:MAG: alanine--glyoxylate aminotransferase family protein [Candidatus Altiarchaeota archaeon]|nr:alanine--glyoxylate aminotransferase family protein [Candidatus Altiarchaeota archaeon]